MYDYNYDYEYAMTPTLREWCKHDWRMSNAKIIYARCMIMYAKLWFECVMSTHDFSFWILFIFIYKMMHWYCLLGKMFFMQKETWSPHWGKVWFRNPTFENGIMLTKTCHMLMLIYSTVATLFSLKNCYQQHRLSEHCPLEKESDKL